MYKILHFRKINEYTKSLTKIYKISRVRCARIPRIPHHKTTRATKNKKIFSNSIMSSKKEMDIYGRGKKKNATGIRKGCKNVNTKKLIKLLTFHSRIPIHPIPHSPFSPSRSTPHKPSIFHFYTFSLSLSIYPIFSKPSWGV